MPSADWAAPIRMAAMVVAVAWPLRAEAQVQRAPPRAAPAASPGTVVPSTPQQTTASFADWTLRCTQTGSEPRFCEVVQSIQQNERTVAQVAAGRPKKGQRLQFTILVPPNVSLNAEPSLLAGSEGEGAPVLTLAWRRCLPVGCMADAPLGDEVVTRLRGWTEPGRIMFTDAAGRPAGLPFSPRGLAQALDALAKEEGPG